MTSCVRCSLANVIALLICGVRLPCLPTHGTAQECGTLCDGAAALLADAPLTATAAGGLRNEAFCSQ
jgi:hypothetical protein